MREDLDQALREFVAESREGLGVIEAALLAAETSPGAAPDVAHLFRIVHTIKGTAGFFALARVERVAHAAEGALAALRERGAPLDAKTISALLAAVDALRTLLEPVERTRREADLDIEHLLGRFAPRPSGSLEVEPARQADPARHDPDSSVRVDTALLDRLMTLVGELVLVRNQALQRAQQAPDSRFMAPVQRLNLVATELQQAVMKTRMQPIGNAWSSLPRLTRDLALQRGKRVRLELEGEATELDRTIMDAVRDPLTHLVRNAIDHGIEPPPARTAKGKPPEGRVHLRATHEGGTVNVEVADDGAGLDLARIAAKAVERGLLGTDEAARATPEDLTRLVFRPGFSTAAEVTTLSGRGVGLDVVRSNIERIGGTVDLRSQADRGTVVRLKIPLTLAIIPALVVTSAGQRYLLSQADVVEVVRVEDRSALSRVLGAPVLRLRGRLLTLLDLARELAPGGQAAGAAHIVVVRSDASPFGLVVDEALETEEIVVKPLPCAVRDMGVYSGATILGDGRVALILDTAGLARRASLAARREAVAAPATEAAPAEHQTLLVAEVAGGERVAIPLSVVARLEELRPSRLERSGGTEVVQYRGGILSLFDLSTALGRTAPPTRGEVIPVVVHAADQGSAGLIVERIVDIVDEPLAMRRESRRPGVAFTSVVQGRITDVLDVPALLARRTS